MSSVCMWSGPRNISTAMMRAFENRPDCSVVDEPFYACYLKHSGVVHPMQEEILSSQPNDWQGVIDQLEAKPETTHFYQKHMTHHMLPDVPMAWCRDMKHCFLIRDPELVVNSYSQKRDSVTEADIGIKRQYELYEEISSLVDEPVAVIDSSQFLMNPEGHLRAICDYWGMDFVSEMLAWPTGIRDSDGVWAPHWYEAVAASTGFAPFTKPRISLAPELKKVADEARPFYLELNKQALEI